MAHKHKTYSAYKDSGIAWLGDVPEHWELGRNKNFLTETKTIVGDSWRDYTLLSLGKGGVTVRDIHSGKGKFPESFENYQVVKPNQLIFCLFDMEETPRTVGLSSLDGMITSAYTVFKCNKNVSKEFIYYYYLAIDEFKGLKPYYSGLRKTIRPAKFLSIYMYLPPLAEQQAIADFLDAKGEQINSLIEKKKKQIELLQEKRIALITQAVTKGLNPKVKMKPSEIEWLGDIPEHWDTFRLKWTNSKLIAGAWGDDPKGEDSDIFCIRVADFDRRALRINIGSLTLRNVEIKKQQVLLLKKNDLLLEKSGGGEKQPVGCIVLFTHDFRAIASNFICKITITKNNSAQYLIYLHAYLRSIGINIFSIKQTTGIQNLDVYTYFNERVAHPPLAEQQAIANFLDKETAKIDTLIGRVEDSITLLREYRTALITAAVTGTIDVRQTRSE